MALRCFTIYTVDSFILIAFALLKIASMAMTVKVQNVRLHLSVSTQGQVILVSFTETHCLLMFCSFIDLFFNVHLEVLFHIFDEKSTRLH